MYDSLERFKTLLHQLLETKQNLADALVEKGEEADFKEPFSDLVQKAAEYLPKSYIFVDESGREFPGTLVDELTIFDVTPNDVRVGKTYVGELGVDVGEKEIPSYNTVEGIRVIMPGKPFVLGDKHYDYTKLQALICLFNTSLSDSVSTEQVVIENHVYEARSVEPVSTITINSSNQTIEFGITNNSDNPQIIRFIYYKEMY